MNTIADRFPCIDTTHLERYITEIKISNIAYVELFADIGTWAVTTSGIADHYHPSTWDFIHNHWLGKAYSREQAGEGDCHF